MKTLIDNENPRWGIKKANDNDEETKLILAKTCVKIVRIASYYSDSKVWNPVANDYLRNGFEVQINLNWKPTTSPSDYPTNDYLIRAKGEEFFQYYLQYKHLIPVVVVGNEWDNRSYHTGTNAQYLNELAILTEVGHKYGFLIASAGLTGNGLGRWTYSKLTGAEKTAWGKNYFVGLKKDYDLMVKTIDEFCEGAKRIDYDFANTHWYNKDKVSGGYPRALKLYMDACGKTRAINNEFGIKATTSKVNKLLLFAETIKEMVASGIEIGILYSADGRDNNAELITDEMIRTLV